MEGNYPYMNFGVCVETCPSDTVVFDMRCTLCSEMCVVCADDSLTCLECKEGFYLYEGDCVDECPSDTELVGNECMIISFI